MVSKTLNLYIISFFLYHYTVQQSYKKEYTMKKSNHLIITHIKPLAIKTSYSLPLLLQHVSAGFPSPADDYSDQALDLNELLIKHPSATFFMRVEGDSMKNAGINSGDTLIVDRAAQVKNNSIVVAHINGELTVKRIKKVNNILYLVPENSQYKPITITEEMDFEIWGVVTFVIHAAQ